MYLTWNGIFVTSASPSEWMKPGRGDYRGPAYGKPWPLSKHSADRLGLVLTPDDGDIVDRVWRESIGRQLPEGYAVDYAPDVLWDLEPVDTYVSCCHRHDIGVRTLLVATISPEPWLDDELMPMLLAAATHLGYDYWDGREFSALYSDRWLAQPALEQLAKQLNRHMLFDTLSDLDEYIRVRTELETRHNVDLEDIEYMATDAYELNWADVQLP